MIAATSEKKVLDAISANLSRKQSTRINLPNDGILNIDQPVPFLLIYRYPASGKDNFIYQLGRTEASYMMISNDDEGLSQLIVQELSAYYADSFGAFMIMEIWEEIDEEASDFTIHVQHPSAIPIAETLQQEINNFIDRPLLTVSVKQTSSITPPYGQPIATHENLKKSATMVLGISIRPFYINPATEKSYPLLFRNVRSIFGSALKKVFFEFVRLHTSYNASHFHMLGRTVVEDLVWEVDEKLAEYSNQFDFLFLVTPVNVQEEWKTFLSNKYQKPPIFHYRHVPIDPELIKRKLYNLPIEEISDPTIAFLFRDKRKEVDKMLTMLADREKPDFIHSSLQLFGGVDENLLEIARALLLTTPQEEEINSSNLMGAEEFASLALKELHYLQEQYPAVSTEIKIREDIEGVLVSKGILFISKNFRLSRDRAHALLQHEVGTHITTYYNGKSQPFNLLYSGVPGYEQLQEGLAVLAEYAMGGLTNARLRILAARVIAVHHLTNRHSFVETFHLLTGKYKFAPETAFTLTMRVYRGGGLTKDAVYLKGLISLLNYLKEGNNIEPLLIGKIRQDYLPIVQELMHRKLLKPVPIKPRFLNEPYKNRIENLKNGATIFNLTKL